MPQQTALMHAYAVRRLLLIMGQFKKLHAALAVAVSVAVAPPTTTATVAAAAVLYYCCMNSI